MPDVPPALIKALSVVHRLVSFLPGVVVAVLDWGPHMVGSSLLAELMHVGVGPLLPTATLPYMVLGAACLAATPLEFLTFGAAVHGAPLQRPLAGACAAALAAGFHLPRLQCEALTLTAALALSPGWYGTTASPWVAVAHVVLLFRAVATPAFPGGGSQATGIMKWFVDTQATRCGCTCYASTCREAILPGQLRARSAANTANPRWFHVGCVEGGLGPEAEVEGFSALRPEKQDEVRAHCDQPGRPTRETYVALARRAKRLRTGQERPPDGMRPPEHADQSMGNDLPEDGADGVAGGAPMGQELNVAWWDGVQFSALDDRVPTLGRAPADTHRGLAMFRGAVRGALRETRASETRSARPALASGSLPWTT